MPDVIVDGIPTKHVAPMSAFTTVTATSAAHVCVTTVPRSTVTVFVSPIKARHPVLPDAVDFTNMGDAALEFVVSSSEPYPAVTLPSGVVEFAKWNRTLLAESR